MARKHGNRLMHTSFVVLGDGITEQYYLKHLKAIKSYKYTIRPYLFASITIETAEDIIDELLSGGCNQIVYFTDYDTIVNQNKKDKFDALIKKYTGREEVLICESMPSIEFWFLLHFIKTTREYSDANQVTRNLAKYIKSYSKNKGFLENQEWVNELTKNGNFENAILNSKSVLEQKETTSTGSHFPFSKVHIGIERFNDFK